jgi:hypothetical protein
MPLKLEYLETNLANIFIITMKWTEDYIQGIMIPIDSESVTFIHYLETWI